MRKKLEEIKTDDSIVVICNPTFMPHVEDVMVRQCELCGQEIWFAGSTKRHLEEKEKEVYHLICGMCAISEFPEEEIFAKMEMPSDEQLREVSKETGVSSETIKQRIVDLIQAGKMAVNAPNN